MANCLSHIASSGGQTANGEIDVYEAAAEMLLETAVSAAKEIPIDPTRLAYM